ncbi:MAG: hypothetical protein AAGD32_15205 [Planctomycetota bacterium]
MTPSETKTLGKAVKIIHTFLAYLPDRFRYIFLFIKRDLDDVITSQAKILQRLHTTDAFPSIAVDHDQPGIVLER